MIEEFYLFLNILAVAGQMSVVTGQTIETCVKQIASVVFD